MLSPDMPTRQEVEPTPTQAWRDFYPWFISQWQQGEHLTCIAPTGWGKTTLMIELLAVRRYIVAFGVKGRDDTMVEMMQDLRLMRQKEFTPDVADRVALWPDIRGVGKDHTKRQREVFLRACDTIFRTGGWCAYFDEVVYLAEVLGMESELKMLLNQGRSSYITVVATTQRPAFIPLAFYDQASHMFIGKDMDHRNVKRLSELMGEAAQQVKMEIPTLRKHEFLYVNRDTGHRIKTLVEV